MISFIPSKHPDTIAFEIHNRPEKEDAVLLDQAVAERFGAEAEFNLFIIAKDLGPPTVQGITERLKFLAAHSGRVNRTAICSDEEMVEVMKLVANILSGTEAKRFSPDQQEEAWEWLRR